VKLHSLRGHSLYVAPIRIGLGLVWLVAGLLAGVTGASALLAFGTGGLAIVFLAFNDPRSRYFARRRSEALPMPADATVAPRWRQALSATLPSTAGVSVLAAIAFALHPVLSVFLGGVSAGLGIAGVLFAVRTDPAYLVDPHDGTLYVR
jgi:hypothetical protein